MKSIATSRGKYWKRIFRNAALCSTTMSSLVHFWNVMTPTVAKRHKACQIEPKKPVFHFVTYCHLLGLLRPPGLFEEKKWKKKNLLLVWSTKKLWKTALDLPNHVVWHLQLVSIWMELWSLRVNLWQIFIWYVSCFDKIDHPPIFA